MNHELIMDTESKDRIVNTGASASQGASLLLFGVKGSAKVSAGAEVNVHEATSDLSKKIKTTVYGGKREF